MLEVTLESPATAKSTWRISATTGKPHRCIYGILTVGIVLRSIWLETERGFRNRGSEKRTQTRALEYQWSPPWTHPRSHALLYIASNSLQYWVLQNSSKHCSNGKENTVEAICDPPTRSTVVCCNHHSWYVMINDKPCLAWSIDQSKKVFLLEQMRYILSQNTSAHRRIIIEIVEVETLYL